MNIMRTKIINIHFGWLLLGQLLVLSLVVMQTNYHLVVADSNIDTSANEMSNHNSGTSSVDKPGDRKSASDYYLMSWRSFMETYNKHYPSLSQHLARRAIFMTRLMEAFSSLVKFIRKQVPYYLVINQFSDLTAEEGIQLLSGEATPASDINQTAPQTVDDPLMADDQAQQLLEADIEAADQSGSRPGGDGPEQQQHLKRPKRSIFERFIGQPLSASLVGWPSGLIRANSFGLTGRPEEAQKAPVDNVRWIVPSTNADYEPISEHIERQRQEESQLIADSEDHDDDDDQAEEAHVGYANADGDAAEYNHYEDSSGWDFGLMGSLRSVLDGAYNWLVPKEGQSAVLNFNWLTVRDKIDESTLTIDWRRSGCIREPLDQGHCKSCYAISTMSYIEWALCMQQGAVLTPLSARYMVDCGRQYSAENDFKFELSGCDGGLIKHSIKFVRSYGVELEANLPYVDYESNCPIPYGTSPTKRGYLRPRVMAPVRMGGQTKQLDLALKKGPLVVSFLAPKNFLAYGGGMIDSCYSTHNTGHAMLVVGSGQEAGVDYLLIKNWFGPNWGLGGYFKFKRSASESCVKEFISHRVIFPKPSGQTTDSTSGP